MKYKIQIGDLFVHYKYKKPNDLFYIKGMNEQQTEFKVYWFDNLNRHSFYSEKTLKYWISKGIYHYYPVVK
jgi:hypothetical protein